MDGFNETNKRWKQVVNQVEEVRYLISMAQLKSEDGINVKDALSSEDIWQIVLAMESLLEYYDWQVYYNGKKGQGNNNV